MQVGQPVTGFVPGRRVAHHPAAPTAKTTTTTSVGANLPIVRPRLVNPESESSERCGWEWMEDYRSANILDLISGTSSLKEDYLFVSLFVWIFIFPLYVLFLQPVILACGILIALVRLVVPHNGEYGRFLDRFRFLFDNLLRPTFADLFVAANFAAFAFHLVMMFVVLNQRSDSDDDKYVRLPVWISVLEVNASCTGSGGVGGTTASAPFELIPTYKKVQGCGYWPWLWDPDYCDSDSTSTQINLTAITAAFFALSAFFHFLNLIFIAIEKNKSLNKSLGKPKLYLGNIDICMQPTRWVEYSLSASLMMIIVSFFSGVRDLRMLIVLFGLMFCVITYGWVCEALSRPKILTFDFEAQKPTSYEREEYDGTGNEKV